MNRPARVSFAKIRSKFGATADRGTERDRVVGLFEKAPENRRYNTDWTLLCIVVVALRITSHKLKGPFIMLIKQILKLSVLQEALQPSMD